MIGDKRLAAEMKGKVYKRGVKQPILYAKRQEVKPEVAELRMSRFSLSLCLFPRVDRIKNKHIRGTPQV